MISWVGSQETGFIPDLNSLTLSLCFNVFPCWVSALSCEQNGDEQGHRGSLGFRVWVAVTLVTLALLLCVLEI